MPVLIRTYFLVSITSLILAPAASAHHHWNDGDVDQPWNDQATEQPQPVVPQPVAPQPIAQGDPQETPTDWNNDPWSSIPALPISKTPTVAGKPHDPPADRKST